MVGVTVYVLIFASALAVAAGAIPLLRRAAPRLGFMDHPSARKVHQTPIPRLGGVGIYIAFIIALALFENSFNLAQVVSIILGATLMSFMGLADDRRSLPAWVKLVGQLIAAGILIASGVQISVLPWRLLNIAATLLWVVGITNAMNLLDNMDGLSAGVTAIAAGFILLLAAGSGQYLVGGLAAALLGACIGFLFYNFNPALIFMGDSGSLFIGFILAALGIKLRFPSASVTVTWMIPILVLGLPIFDTTLVFISRLRRGVNPLTAAGKDHTSHRLVERGMTKREAVLTLYLAGGLLGALALFIVQATRLEAYALGALTALMGAYLLWRFEWRRPAPPSAAPTTSKAEISHTEELSQHHEH